MSREQAIERALEKWLQSGGFRPATRSEMARELGVAPGERRMFRAMLRRWLDDGRLRVGKQGRFRPASGGDARGGGLVVGTLRRWRNGRVLLEVRSGAAEVSGSDDSEPRPKGLTMLPFEDGRWGAALPGDLVEARPKTTPMRTGGRGWRGLGEDEVMVQLVRIVRRARHQLVGRLRRERGYLSVVVDEPMYPGRIELSPDDALADGVADDRPVVVALAVEDWDTRQRAARGFLVRVLDQSAADDPWMMRVILRHGLPLEFPPEVLQEAQQAADIVTAEQAGDREDWRGELVVTIDPDDAKDFDDAISVKQNDDGWQVAVHIADVAFYVPAGGAMDREALERGNSVYLADRVIPMLPEKLSNGICSLRPGEDRLAQAVVLMIDRHGKVKETRFSDTVIHSRRRFTYAEAMRIIGGGDDGRSEGEHEVREEHEVTVMLKQARDLAMLLRKRRMSRGSLDLDMPEVRAVLDERGEVTGIERIEHDQSHQLIEEFMLAANEAVAVELQRHGASGVHRVHDEPDEEKLLAFAELAALHGHRVADPTDPVQLNQFLVKIRGTVAERSLKTALLRSLKRAEYNSQSLGHFGLAKDHYLHFTSPIRRYADLVVHRSLRALRRRKAGRGKGEWKDLRQIASHLSQTERTAADAEMESQRVKQLQYLGRMAEQSGGFQATAVIMEVRPHSMAVELEPWMIRGWIRAASLPGGRYWFDAPLNRLVCRDGGRGRRDAYRLGDRLQVRVSRIDLHELQVDFEVVA